MGEKRGTEQLAGERKEYFEPLAKSLDSMEAAGQASAAAVDDACRFLSRLPRGVKRPTTEAETGGAAAIVWKGSGSGCKAVFVGDGGYSWTIEADGKVEGGSASAGEIPAKLSELWVSRFGTESEMGPGHGRMDAEEIGEDLREN